MLSPHEIPTHLGVRDRVLGRLTMRQVLILLSGASVAYQASAPGPWLSPGLRACAVAAAIGLTVAVALPNPGGRTVETWVIAVIRYALLPKRSVWRPRAPMRQGRPSEPGWTGHAPALAWPAGSSSKITVDTRTAVAA